jgi:hypothetical protein
VDSRQRHGYATSRPVPAWAELPGVITIFPLVGIVVGILSGPWIGLAVLAMCGTIIAFVIRRVGDVRPTGYTLTPAQDRLLRRTGNATVLLAVTGYGTVLVVGAIVHSDLWWFLMPAAIGGVGLGLYVLRLLAHAVATERRDHEQRSGTHDGYA